MFVITKKRKKKKKKKINYLLITLVKNKASSSHLCVKKKMSHVIVLSIVFSIGLFIGSTGVVKKQLWRVPEFHCQACPRPASA